MEARSPIIDADLSSWSREQEKLIKKALLEYKSRSPRTRGLSWEGVQRDVEHVTGVSMGGKDHFRQFIAGTRPATDNPERRRAIVEFATDPDVDLLSRSEFLEPSSFLHAPRRLLDYLRTDLDPVDMESPLRRICGLYVSETTSERNNTKITLNILATEDHDWILRVTEASEQLRPQSHSKSSGWCVLTPEDNLLFFMKEDQYGRNHYYHLVTDVEIWTDSPLNRFLLLRHDYPESLLVSSAAQNSDLAYAAKRFTQKALVEFTRMDDASSLQYQSG